MSNPSEAWLKMSQEEFDQHFAKMEASLAAAHTEDVFIEAFASFAEQIFARAEDPGKKLGKLVFHMIKGVTQGYWWGNDGGET